MKLKEALLCVECESLYSSSSSCPHCGSQVSFPLGRAFDRRPALFGSGSVRGASSFGAMSAMGAMMSSPPGRALAFRPSA